MVNKYSIGIIVFLAVTLAIIVFVSEGRLKKEIDDLEIFGVIEEIQVREKGISYFKVKGKWISFSYFGYSFDDFVLTSDSLVKNKNELNMKVYRKKGNQYRQFRVIEFD